MLRFDLSGAVLDEALHAVGHMPLPPYIASKRAGRRARPKPTTRPSMPARRAPSRRRRPACISRRSCSPRSTQRGIERAFRDAACRRRHLPAGQGRRHRRPQDACRERQRLRRRRPRRVNAARARGSRIVAVGTTSLRLLESAADGRRHARSLVRRDRTSSSRRATASGPSTR